MSSDVVVKLKAIGSLLFQNALRVKFITESDFESLSFLVVNRYLRSEDSCNTTDLTVENVAENVECLVAESAGVLPIDNDKLAETSKEKKLAEAPDSDSVENAENSCADSRSLYRIVRRYFRQNPVTDQLALSDQQRNSEIIDRSVLSEDRYDRI